MKQTVFCSFKSTNIREVGGYKLLGYLSSHWSTHIIQKYPIGREFRDPLILLAK